MPTARECEVTASSQASDVLICGYPRSGVTWFQYLIAGLVYGVDPEFAHDALVQALVPDISKRCHQRIGTTAYFKSYGLPKKQYRRVVYLLRDGRDAMVSYYHYLTARHGRVDFQHLVTSNEIEPCRWHDHVTHWLANPYGAEILLLKYEDLRTEPLRELKRFCSFAGLSREPAQLKHIAERSEFQKAQARERRMGWENVDWPRDKPLVRRGVVGSYRDEMPAPILSLFLQKAGPTLERFGYDTKPNHG